MKPERCPICYGKGTVPASFYEGSEYYTSTSDSEVTCKSCNGCGYILCPEG